MSSRGQRRTSLALRSLLYFALAYLLLIGAMGWFVSRSVEAAFTERLLDQLETAARISASGMPAEPELQTWVEDLAAASGFRYTVVDAAGVVLADSHGDTLEMESHASRPEVAAALAGEAGRDIRLSETVGFEQLYVAIPVEQGWALRLSVAARDLAMGTWPYRSSILLIAILAGVIGLGVVAWLARRMSAPVSALTTQTLRLAEGGGGEPLPRSDLLEIDQLAWAISRLDAERSSRLADAERASSTLEVVLGALPQGTILFDEEDSVVYANPSAYELLGAVPDSLLGLVPFSFQRVVEECRQERVPSAAVAEHGKPVRTLRALATPFAEDQRVLLVVVDVTERERAASVRRDFVANASHELKTPVSSIIASSEALRIAVERGDESSLRFAGQIETSARQLDRLVADLLDLSRLERDEPEMVPQGLDHVVREELERIRPLAEESEIHLTLDLIPVRVAGSRRDLSIAVRNLLDNAIRYTGAGGTIGAELTTEGEEALLVVSDTGDGIPTRDLARIFERFYRVDSARARSTGGTGLGLAIVKHVVESHGGSVGVESELGAGSRFTVRLPLLGEETTASG